MADPTALLWVIGLALSADFASADQQPNIDFLFTAFADNQQRLRSGVVRMEGTVVNRSNSGNIEGPVSLFCAFDLDAKLFRFDRSEPVRPAPSGLPGPSPQGAIKPVIGGGKYAVTPKRVVIWNAEFPKTVRIVPLGFMPSQIAPTVFPFYPHILGLANLVTLRHGYPPDQLVPALRKRLANDVTSVSEVRPGVTRVQWSKNGEGLEIDFDGTAGYMPIRYADIIQLKKNMPASPFDTAVTTWLKRGEVYVPATARFQDGPDDAPDLMRYDLKLTWEVVNGPVDEALTTARGMSLPVGTEVTDNTTSNLGQPLGKVGDLTPDPKLASVENNPVPASASRDAPPVVPQPRDPTRTPRWVYALAAGLAAVGVGLLTLIRRARR